MKSVVESQQQRREQRVNRTMIPTPVKKAHNVMTIRRGLDHSFIKGLSEKSRSSNKEEIAQQQNTIEIELNKNKINNTSYDKHPFNNAEESDSNDDDNDDVPPLATRYDAKGHERDSDDDNEDETLPDAYYAEQDLNAADSEEESSKDEEDGEG